MNDTPNPMFAKFDQALGVKSPTTMRGPVQSRANEIRNLTAPASPADNNINVGGKTLVGGAVGGFLKRAGSDIQTAGQNVNSAISGTDQFSGQGPIQRGTGAAAEALATPVKVASEALPAPIRAGIGKVGEVAGGVINKLGEVLGSTKLAQDFVTKHPDAAKTLEAMSGTATNLGNIAGTTLTEAAGANALQKGADITGDVVNKAKDVAANVGEKVNNMLPTEESAVSGNVKDWNKSFNDFAQSKRLAEAASAKGTDLGKFLTDQKISPASLVENGKWSTAEAADSLRENAGKLSEDLIKPALAKADLTNPPISLADFKDAAIENIKNSSSITAADKAAMIRNVTSQVEDISPGSLHDTYGDSIKLSDLSNEKTTWQKNTNFGVTSADKLQGQMNYILGDTAKGMIEDAVPDAPIKDVNAHISQYYNAADALEKLDGKVPKSTFVGRTVKSAIRGVSGAVGGGIGGVGGAIGGYTTSNVLLKAFDSMSNPVREYFLRNLETTNPEAFTAMSKYLGK